MAWTLSAPHRGTVAATAVVFSSHRLLNVTVQRAALRLGRGDVARGLSIGFAAFLTFAGAAAPNMPAAAMTGLLFVSGAMLVLYAVFSSRLDATPDDRLLPTTGVRATDGATQRTAAKSCLTELLTAQPTTTNCDAAAFARLTSHMSHELRTPLNAILGFSEMMSNEVFGPLGSSAYAGYARDIHASGICLLKSAEDALAITSLLTAPDHQHRLATANAALATSEAIAFHAQGLAMRGITTSCTVDADAEMMAAPQTARQLLINLVADAAQRIENGGQLSIASRTTDDTIEVLVSISGRTVLFSDCGDSFSMLLARTLSELSGATLSADLPLRTQTGEWHVAARFARAAQNDFFA